MLAVKSGGFAVLPYLPYSSCTDTVGNGDGFLYITGNNGSCQSIRGFVGTLDNFLNRLELED